MLRLFAIILFIPILSGCTVVEPIDRAALYEANKVAASNTASVAE